MVLCILIRLDFFSVNILPYTPLQIIAREIDTIEKRSSVATVTVNIEDVNDIPPQFSSELFNANISENSPVNTAVTVVNVSNAFSDNCNRMETLFLCWKKT